MAEANCAADFRAEEAERALAIARSGAHWTELLAVGSFIMSAVTLAYALLKAK